MTNTGALQVTTPTDREVVVTRHFAAPCDLVFRAYTTPDLLRQWFHGPPGWTMELCEVDLRVGGRYRYEWSGPDGEVMAVGGEFREVDPPSRLVTTELFDEDWTGGETVVTADFIDQAGQTRLEMTILYASREARDGALASGMTEGMEMGYALLDELLPSLA